MGKLKIIFKKPPTFEEDPINFLVTKYKSLDNTLKSLLTNDYKQYITGIYIVAPKPTTFKIVLHNNQEFILTYLGKAYECKIEGKKYYLGLNSEKLGAIHAIARILELGSPLGYDEGNTESPVGPGDEEFGGGGDAGGGDEEPPADEEGGGDEELKENTTLNTMKKFKKIRIVENKIVKEVRDDGGNILVIINGRAVEDGVTPQEAAIEVIELISDYYELDVRINNLQENSKEPTSNKFRKGQKIPNSFRGKLGWNNAWDISEPFAPIDNEDFDDLKFVTTKKIKGKDCYIFSSYYPPEEWYYAFPIDQFNKKIKENDEEPTGKELRSINKSVSGDYKIRKQLSLLIAKKDQILAKFKAGKINIDQYKELIGDIPQQIKQLTSKLQSIATVDDEDEVNEMSTTNEGVNIDSLKVGTKGRVGFTHIHVKKVDGKKTLEVYHGGNMGNSIKGSVNPNLKVLGLPSIEQLKKKYPNFKESGSPDYMYTIKFDISNNNLKEANLNEDWANALAIGGMGAGFLIPLITALFANEISKGVTNVGKWVKDNWKYLTKIKPVLQRLSKDKEIQDFIKKGDHKGFRNLVKTKLKPGEEKLISSINFKDVPLKETNLNESESFDTKREALQFAKQESIDCGCVQHVQDMDTHFLVDDWYDYETTIASFENGRPLMNEKNNLNEIDLDLLKQYRSKYGITPSEKDLEDFKNKLSKDAEEDNITVADKPVSVKKMSRAQLNALAQLKALEKVRDNVMSDMEQEAEPEGGPIADRYGAVLNKIDSQIAKLRKKFTNSPLKEDDRPYVGTFNWVAKGKNLKTGKPVSLKLGVKDITKYTGLPEKVVSRLNDAGFELGSGHDSLEFTRLEDGNYLLVAEPYPGHPILTPKERKAILNNLHPQAERGWEEAETIYRKSGSNINKATKLIDAAIGKWKGMYKYLDQTEHIAPIISGLEAFKKAITSQRVLFKKIRGKKYR